MSCTCRHILEAAQAKGPTDRTDRRSAAVSAVPENRSRSSNTPSGDRVLAGVQVLELATVTPRGEPRVAPVDGLFFRGHFGWFGGGFRALQEHARQSRSQRCSDARP